MADAFKPCCLTAFQWDGTPEGREGVLNGLPAYVAGSNPDAAVLYVHDALGWQFKNARLLADCYAREVCSARFLYSKLVVSCFGRHALLAPAPLTPPAPQS